jgi:ribulose-5-phosphate 4-epimerase/fuculose-1-phosphate aldolase
MDEQAVRQSIATTARMMSAAGLAEAFGHVSARWKGGFAITSTLPFAVAGPEDVVVVSDAGAPPSGGAGAPLETPMHAAVYLARPDVGAICRGHPPTVVAWGTGIEELPLLHGLGALAGTRVAIHPDTDLVTTVSQGNEVAATLGEDQSVILRANGCLAVGATLLEAVTRLYFLEERARVLMEAPAGARETDWGARLRHTGAELERAMAWFDATYGSA